MTRAEELEAIRARHKAAEAGGWADHDRAFLLAEVERLTAENADLKTSVIAFAGPAAGRYAADAGFAKGELHPTHYDLLEKCGARLVDFTRAKLSEAGQ